MKYRSRTDIVSQMLEAANADASKTKIIYTAYLSHAQLKEYLTMLVEGGLIDYLRPNKPDGLGTFYGKNEVLRRDNGFKSLSQRFYFHTSTTAHKLCLAKTRTRSLKAK